MSISGGVSGLISSANMYARTAFEYNNEHKQATLCKLLKEMDEHEGKSQSLEEKAFSTMMPQCREEGKDKGAKVGLISGASTTTAGMIFSAIGIAATTTLSTAATAAIVVLGGPVLGTAIGVTAGIAYFANFNEKKKAIKKLNIDDHRATRLDTKIRKISEELTRQIPSNEKDQLNTAKDFFSQSRQRYNNKISNNVEHIKQFNGNIEKLHNNVGSIKQFNEKIESVRQLNKNVEQFNENIEFTKGFKENVSQFTEKVKVITEFNALVKQFEEKVESAEGVKENVDQFNENFGLIEQFNDKVTQFNRNINQFADNVKSASQLNENVEQFNKVIQFVNQINQSFKLTIPAQPAHA